MAKKKNKQKHPSVSVADTSDEEINEPKYQGKCCPHVARGINFTRVKKVLKDSDLKTCSACPAFSTEDEASQIWLCLQCGYKGCGRESQNKHALQHFKTIHSDCHALVLSSLTSVVWCYECDEEVHLQSSRNLRQCVEFLVKTNASNKPKNSGIKTQSSKQSLIESVISEQVNEKKSNSKDSLKTMNSSNKNSNTSQKAVVKGLRNLGHTCFFNSVMQNLCQTPFLQQELEKSTASNYTYEVPSFAVKGEEVFEKEPCLRLSLPKFTPMINSLSNFIKQMISSSTSKGVDIVNPKDIFGEVCKKSPRFRHFQQEDSHELLRQLLDGVKQDEIRRQRLAVLRHFNLNGVNPDEVPEDLKKIMKAYSPFTNHTYVEQIFGGVLISTVLCEECKKASQVFEPFMDISLPIFEEKPLRNGKNDTEKDNTERVSKPFKKEYSKPSKHQERKMKEMTKKEKKRNRKLQSKSEEVPSKTDETSSKSGIVNGYADDDYDDDKENIDDKENKFSVSNELESKEVALNEDSNKKTGENQALESLVNELFLNLHLKKSDMTNLSHADSDEDQTLSVHINKKPNPADESKSDIQNHDHCYAKKLSHTDEEKTHSDLDFISNNGSNTLLNDSNKEIPKGHLLNNTLVDQMADCNLSEEQSDDKEKTVEDQNSSPNTDREDSPVLCNSYSKSTDNLNESHTYLNMDSCESSKESNTKEWVQKSLSTLGPRNHASPLECSVDSCLVHFTKPELLVGSNKFRCENCTKIRCKKTGNEKDVVYTNASKQLLIFSPPAVLTLHLKRFQQVNMSLRKVNKFVEFPIMLDLSPYCSYACLMLPHMSSVKSKVLYSLYGVVEHAGLLNSGHYTAYVKFNRRTPNRTFLNQLPIQHDFEQLLQKFPKDLPQAEAEDEALSEQSRWFHISDIHVKEVNESQVLKCQAYLLFYERIK